MTAQQLAWLIRRHAVEMTHVSGGSHIGAAMSCADIIAVLYSEILNIDPQNPKWEKRGRFIMSKGHAGCALYVALAESGFFPVAELMTHYADGSRLSGHVSSAVPGVDFSTGSLGHGLSVACGMATAAKMDKKEHRIFCLLGDGECNEGSVWEAVQYAAYFGLDNLIAIVDNNHMQSLDFRHRTMSVAPLADMWRGFGWNVIEANGNDCDAVKAAIISIVPNGRPTVIIADTVKGKGVDFMESDILWHYRFPHEGWEYDGAVAQLYAQKPDGVEDPYTPGGIPNPVLPEPGADIFNDHTVTATYNPTWFALKGEKK